MSIEVIFSGLQTTIQDLGRKGWRHMGVPESGAADKFSLKLANFLLNKKLNSSVLESSLNGPILKFLKPMNFVVTGADMQPKINKTALKMNTPSKAQINDVLSLSHSSAGCRSYIAFSEDLISESFLESTSTYLPAKLGGAEGLPLQTGAVIKTKSCELNTQNSQKIDLNLINPFTNKWILRVMKGPEFYSLSSESRVNIFASSYTVSNDSSRMGNRLDGTRMELFDSKHMVTAPVNLGTIQCPKNGLPIILGCDSQTLGGYPRILQIAEVDFPIIGQLRPHDKVSFVRVSIEEARDKLKQLELIHPF